jgi:hypothetical protein
MTDDIYTRNVLTALRACSMLCGRIIIDADAKPELRKEAALVLRKIEAVLLEE